MVMMMVMMIMIVRIRIMMVNINRMVEKMIVGKRRRDKPVRINRSRKINA